MVGKCYFVNVKSLKMEQYSCSRSFPACLVRGSCGDFQIGEAIL